MEYDPPDCWPQLKMFEERDKEEVTEMGALLTGPNGALCYVTRAEA